MLCRSRTQQNLNPERRLFSTSPCRSLATMLLLRRAGTRLCPVATRSTPPARGQHFYSSNSKASSSPSKTLIYAATASVIAAPALWWAGPADQVPRLGKAPTEHLEFQPGPSKEDVTRIISQGAYSFSVKDVLGVTRYDGAQLASNSPCEDRFTHGKFTSPSNNGNEWMAWAVFDGHAGWQTANLLEKHLLSFVRHNLSQVWKSASNGSVPAEIIRHAITRGFISLDDAIIKSASDTSQSSEPLQDKIMKLATGHAGSCALLSLYDPSTSTLHVACTGDSRAVLGRQGPDGKWKAIPLSVDQTGKNEQEVARLNAEHPNEEDVVKNGRVLGIAVSRAFGDGRWKWPLDLQQDLKARFYGQSPLTPKYPVRTPPYLTAEPVVTSTKIETNVPAFLIMATDGLWDTLSSQQAVDLVGAWLETKSSGKKDIKPEPTYKPFDFGQFWEGVNWKFVDGRTTIQDDNVAVHLVRNSLGGNHYELVAGRLAFSPPNSRSLRDDTTVQVVFFNQK